jgi:hypothetical protein
LTAIDKISHHGSSLKYMKFSSTSPNGPNIAEKLTQY